MTESLFKNRCRQLMDACRAQPFAAGVIILNFLTYSICVFLCYRYLANDDVFITLRYADNIAHGNGFVFNIGERVLGTTTPLFALILGLFGAIFSSLEVLCVRALQISLILLAIVTWRIGVRSAGWRGGLGALFVPWMLFADKVLIHSFGMETPFFILILAILFLFHSEKTQITSGVLLALLILIRPEGIIAAPVLFIDSLRSRKIPWKGIISFAIAYGIWALFALLYFGSPFPNSLSAKVIQGSLYGRFDFIRNIGTKYWGWYLRPWLILGMIGMAVAIIRRQRAPLLFGGWAVLCLTGYTIASAPDYSWYYLPIFWIIYLFAGCAIGEFWGWADWAAKKLFCKPNNSPSPVANTIFTILLILLAVSSVRSFRRELLPEWFIQDKYQTGAVINVDNLTYKKFGEWIHLNTSPDAQVTCIEVGLIGFYGKRYVNDLAGLVNPNIFQYLKEEKYDWWIQPYKLPKYLIVHIPVWRKEGIRQDFLRYFYRPIFIENGRGLFVLKAKPEEYDFKTELAALEAISQKSLASPSRKNLDQWIGYATYLTHDASLLAAYEAAYKRYPYDRYYRAGLAGALMRRKPPDNDKSLALYWQLIREFPEEFNYLNNLAELLVRTNQTEKAIAPVTSYTKKFPNDAQGLGLLSRLHRLAGDPKEALAIARRLIQMEPDIFWHYRTLALACEANGMDDEAIGHWLTLEEKSRGKASLNFNLENRIRALKSRAHGEGIPPDIADADRPTTPRLAISLK